MIQSLLYSNESSFFRFFIQIGKDCNKHFIKIKGHDGFGGHA